MSQSLRIFILSLLTLLPLLTAFHRDEQDRWTGNRCCMAAPDEPSYLLMAEKLYHFQTPSIRAAANAETFYPPGFPLILALWARGAAALGFKGLSIECLHMAVAALLCATVPLVYAVALRMLWKGARGREDHDGKGQGAARITALFITALYVTNWYVLETGLFIFSEAAFILVTLLWLHTALRRPDWYTRPTTGLWMIALALAAYAIRGAGLVCVAATLLYPLATLFPAWRRRTVPRDPAFRNRAAIAILLLAIAALTLVALRQLPRSGDDYSGQLLHGLTDNGSFPARLHDHGLTLSLLADWSGYLTHRTLDHFQDWVQCFMPPYRDEPPRMMIYNSLARLLLLLGIAGLLARVFARRQNSPNNSRFVECYVGFYIILYALWPFDMTRFWVPIYPLMLIYAAMMLRATPRMAGASARLTRLATATSATLAALLFLLFAQELVLKLPYYQCRLNLVSDAIASAADLMRHDASMSTPPSASNIRVVVDNDDEGKLIAWYLGSPPWSGLAGSRGIERQILAQMEYVQSHPGAKLYVWSYFAHTPLNTIFPEVFANLRREHPTEFAPGGSWTIAPRLQIWNISALWEIKPAAPPAAALNIHPTNTGNINVVLH